MRRARLRTGRRRSGFAFKLALNILRHGAM